MEQRNFDVVGVRQQGLVAGYVRREDLADGPLKGSLRPFQPGQVLADAEPLAAVVRKLKGRECLLVSAFGAVSGIITKGDLRKTPVQMWLFGFVSLLEMQMLRLIQERFPNGSWQRHLNGNRVRVARRHFNRRRGRNEEVDLADCLSPGDKAKIFAAENDLRQLLGQKDVREIEDFFKQSEDLRDDLAHADDVNGKRWPEPVELVSRAETFLSRLEGTR